MRKGAGGLRGRAVLVFSNHLSLAVDFYFRILFYLFPLPSTHTQKSIQKFREHEFSDNNVNKMKRKTQIKG